MVGRGKRKAFFEIKDRVWHKLQVWKEKNLSRSGKEILIKAMALSIPTYIMSYFKLSKSLCTKLESFIARFWWGQKANKKRIY